MSLWRENMQIPKKEQERKEAAKKGGEIIRTNSFYVAGSGKNIATILNLQKTDVLRAFLYKTIDF